MINSSYTLKYDINNIAHAIFIVYTISGYKGTTEVEDNYLFYSADDAQTISVCFLNDKKTIRVKGADTEKTYFDVNKFFFFYAFFSQVRNIPERIILISTTGLR